MFPSSVVSTVCVSLTATRKVAFGRTSVTVPSSSIASCFAIQLSLASAVRILAAISALLSLRTRIALSCCDRLALPGFTGLHIEPLLSHVLEHAGANDLALELLQRPVQPLIFT